MDCYKKEMCIFFLLKSVFRWSGIDLTSIPWYVCMKLHDVQIKIQAVTISQNCSNQGANRTRRTRFAPKRGAVLRKTTDPGKFVGWSRIPPKTARGRIQPEAIRCCSWRVSRPSSFCPGVVRARRFLPAGAWPRPTRRNSADWRCWSSWASRCCPISRGPSRNPSFASQSPSIAPSPRD